MLKAWIAADVLAVVVFAVGWFFWSTRVEFRTNPVVILYRVTCWPG